MGSNKLIWQKLLAGGFAHSSAPFAVHPIDEWRARKMYYTALRDGATIGDIKNEVRNYLASLSLKPDVIEERVTEVERFIKKIKPKNKKKSAWLITWESMTDEPIEWDKKIIAIRDGRTGNEKIKDFVEQYYVSTIYSIKEKIYYSSHRKDNPYPAEYANHPSGGLWAAKMHCGHDPFISARVVKNLKFFEHDDEVDIVWDEIKAKEMSK